MIFVDLHVRSKNDDFPELTRTSRKPATSRATCENLENPSATRISSEDPEHLNASAILLSDSAY